MSFQITLPKIDLSEQQCQQQNVAWEGELLGIYLTGHPLETAGIQFQKYASLGDITEDMEDQEVKLPVLCMSLDETKTRNGKTMARIEMEDGYRARMKGVVFPYMWTKVQDVVEEHAILYIRGKVNTFNGETNLIIEELARKKGNQWIVPK